MDLSTLKEKLDIEEKTLAKLEAESCNPENMTRIQIWEALVPSLTLAVEKALHPDNVENTANDPEDDNAMNEAQMMSTLTEIRSCIDKKEFENALKLVRKTEKMFPGASDLRYVPVFRLTISLYLHSFSCVGNFFLVCNVRKDKRLEWQVDYFMRLIKKIYVEMSEEADDEDKENVQSVPEGGKKDSKKSKKRRLQDLHPAEDEKPIESDGVKAVSVQSRVVQFLKVRSVCDLALYFLFLKE